MSESPRDRERNRLSGRVSRYARVGAGVGGAAARIAGAAIFGRDLTDQRNAADLVATLGGLKGPLMKVVQMAATIPDLLPPEFAAELQKLQASAPSMGPAFVKRRMMAELGPDWEKRFRAFDRTPAAAASLGQVHKAVGRDGRALACKLQYPDMKSAVEADLGQLGVILALQRRFSPEIDTTEIAEELGERLREELDYEREAHHAALYRAMLAGEDGVRVPETVGDLSTERLLTMTWLEGAPLLSFLDHSLDERNRIATALFTAWWKPFARYGVIHGDPHLGNYTVFAEDGSFEARPLRGRAAQDGGQGEGGGPASSRKGPPHRHAEVRVERASKHAPARPAGINLLDFGCVRIFSPRFVAGVVGLYEGFMTDDEDRIVEAYRAWGFKDLNRETIETLNIWARFIYAPLLDDRVRTIADGIAPQSYGRREVWEVKQRLRPRGPITIPREFVLLDRAAIGLGAVMLHLKAELNFHRLFADAIAGFDEAELARRQATAMKAAGLAADRSLRAGK
jgi:predicted unusual protein kinase regulating ubiquinone biosynthesis (AarF/ABC1/UbiB family)